jgi:hypothetical protein
MTARIYPAIKLLTSSFWEMGCVFSITACRNFFMIGFSDRGYVKNSPGNGFIVSG